MPDLMDNINTSGHGLIEVLTALALASVGIIGFLHAQHLREVTETELVARTYAAMLVQDITRKAAANLGVISAYRTAYGTPPALAADCWQTSCSRRELAAFHVAHWKCRLGRWAQHATCRGTLRARGLLPQGDGRLNPIGGSLSGEIQWLGADRELQSYEINHVLLRR